MSTEPHPIKVIDTAPSENIRVDEIAIETAKAGKVTHGGHDEEHFLAKKDASRRALIPETRSFLAKRRKMPISRRKIPTDQETFL